MWAILTSQLQYEQTTRFRRIRGGVPSIDIFHLLIFTTSQWKQKTPCVIIAAREPCSATINSFEPAIEFRFSAFRVNLMKQAHSNYKWMGLGDVNGFFGLMFDNIAQLSFLAGTLIVGFNFPSDVVYTRMIPGTTMGVLFGDLVYTWMAFRLAKRTGSSDVTAMPLGLDTPSTIGIALTVLGPAFVAMKQAGESPENAAIMTWQIGMATMVMIGILKIFMSFGGNWVQKIVPRAGLLGSIAGVGSSSHRIHSSCRHIWAAGSRNDFVGACPLHPRGARLIPQRSTGYSSSYSDWNHSLSSL